MKKLELVKTIGGVIVSIGVGAIVRNVVEATTPESTKGLKRLVIGIGAFVLGSMVTDKVVKYTDEQFDKTVNDISKMVKGEKVETVKES